MATQTFEVDPELSEQCCDSHGSLEYDPFGNDEDIWIEDGKVKPETVATETEPLGSGLDHKPNY